MKRLGWFLTYFNIMTFFMFYFDNKIKLGVFKFIQTVHVTGKIYSDCTCNW